MEKILDNKFKVKFYCLGSDNKLIITTSHPSNKKYDVSKISELLKIRKKNIEFKTNMDIPLRSNGKIDYQKMQKNFT